MSGYELLAVIAGLTTVASVVESVTKAWARRAEARRPGLPLETEGRLVRIEQTVEAIAVEVERVAEGQRYTTKLLAERAADEAPMRAGRFDAR
jgi:hypothetical protein